MRRIVIAVLAAAIAGAAAPAATWAAPPRNDDYLRSLAIPRSTTGRLTRQPVRDRVSTAEATTQADLFSPMNGGGPEPTTCGAARFGRTVWYDASSSVSGVAEVRAAGFDAVIAVHEFDPRTLHITRTVACFSEDDGPVETGILPIRKGRAYTLQIGGADTGAGPAGGELDFSFEFFSDADEDGVIDGVDRCERVRGPARSSGCPPRLSLDPKLRAVPTATGIRVLRLSAAVTRGARVEVRCRRGCSGREVRRARSRSVVFRRLNGRSLPAGATIEIRATRRNSIGAFTRYRIARGDFRRTDRCLRPGSRIPRRTCR